MTYRKTLLVVILAIVTTLCVTFHANAIDVPSGCAIPKPKLGHHIFFVDPKKGNINNDGSKLHPWKTLEEVVDSKNKLIATRSYSGNYQHGDRNLIYQNPSAPIKSGDVIQLMSGDHGNVRINGINEEFITVQAAPDQTPILRSLRVDWASKWKFVGLKVQGAVDGSTNSSPGQGLVDFGHNLWRGPSDNIIFINGSISTVNDASGWSAKDWVNKPFMWGLRFGASCVTISGNNFFNLRNAVNIDGDHALVTSNRINDFGNDGIDLVASHVIVRGNTITNGRHTSSEPLHPDAIQGWTKKGQTNTDIIIEQNRIIHARDPEINGLQGITIFDGKWNGIRVLNNVVVTNTWHGITFSGVNNGQVINNTVVASDPIKRPTWISVGPAKDGKPSKNVVVRNNITTRLIYRGDNITVDHNIVAQMISADRFGKPIYIVKSGRYTGHNILDPEIYDTLVNINNVEGRYDVHLRENSPAIGTANPALAPNADITGKKRVAPIDIGAYARGE